MSTNLAQKSNPSIAKNSVFYAFYNFINVFFPFLTGMIVSRVLSKDAFGQITYIQNIVQYFVIFAYLGIPTYGLREIIKVRNDKEKLNKLFSELFIINFISTFIFCFVYFISVFSIPSFKDSLPLYLIVGSSLFLNFFNIDFLYYGLEQFTFISIKNTIFKLLVFLILVIFIKNDSDIILYASLFAIGTAGNYITNLFFSRKYVKLTFKGLCFKKHMPSILRLIIVNLAIEVYSLIDITMLGSILPSKESVATYSYANRITKIVITIINSFTLIVIPRLSKMYEEKKYDDFNHLLSKSLKLIIILGVPLVIGILFVADDAINILYTTAYSKSAKVLKILSAITIISPIGYLLGSRVLLVTGNEKKMIYAVIIGAVVNIILNAILISRLKEVGAAIASLISEILVASLYIGFGKKYFRIVDIDKMIGNLIVPIGTMLFFLFLFKYIFSNIYFRFSLSVCISAIIYFLLLILQKDNLIYPQYIKIRSKFFDLFSKK